MNKRFEKYGFFLIKEYILKNIRNAHEFHVLKSDFFTRDWRYELGLEKILCNVADVIVDDPHAASQAIENFLKECFDSFESISYDFIPLSQKC